jgi:ATP-binding cassette subfamily B protein/subfamily B ATP-binding cassette protein MsbA
MSMRMSPAARMLAPYLKRERGALLLATMSTIVSTVADLAKPWPLALVVDRIFASHKSGFSLTDTDLQLLLVVAALTIAIALADACAQYAADLMLQRAGERITHELRDAVYAHLQRLSLGFHQRSQKGDLVTRVTGDVNAIGDLFSQSLGSMAQSMLLVVGMFTVVLFIDPIVALAAFATTPALAAISLAFRRRVRAQARVRRRHDGAIASMANEALSAMPVVKAFGTEDHEHERITIRSAERMGIGMQLARLQARFDGAVGTINAIGMALVIVVGVLRGAAGALSAGDLVVLVNYARKASSPLGSIAKEATKVASDMASAERIADILSTDEIVPERPNAYRGEPARGEVELRDVSFGYSPDRPSALHDVSLKLEAGSRVALIGASGAGKTTVGALVARFYDPSGGAVTIDGHDLRDCGLSWLREQVGVLLQDTVLFTGTVAENIAYGSNATPEEVRAAAQAAAADSFVESLPDGYETKLGPQGVGLSGGQRQRIGIARTLLRNPPVLVLDEPTTGLDVESQERVMEGLSALMRGRTTLLITHALELAGTADRVILMRDGRIARDGTPEELLEEVGGAPAVASAAAPARRRLTHDPKLPQLGDLLDLEAASAALERSLGAGRELEDVEISRVAYRPGVLADVHYRVSIDGRRHDAVASALAADHAKARKRRRNWEQIAHEARERTGEPHALFDDSELDALITWLPFDPLLPALNLSTQALTLRLRQAGVEVGPDAGEAVYIGYKPRARAVLGLDRHVLKAYGHERQYGAALTGLLASQRTPVPAAELEAAFPELRLTVQKRLKGELPDDAGAIAREAGELTRDLQRAGVSGLERVGDEYHLAAAARKSDIVASLLPDLEGRLTALLRKLMATMPRVTRLVPCHGDFHPDQMIQTKKGLAVVDFDGMCLAAPAQDIATYLADVVRGRRRDDERLEAVREPLLDGYGRVPESLDWYLATAILGRVAHPFQRQVEDWPARVEATLAAAERAVS